MKDFKPMVKMQAGGTVPSSPYNYMGPLGNAKPGGPITPDSANNCKMQQYKSGGKRK